MSYTVSLSIAIRALGSLCYLSVVSLSLSRSRLFTSRSHVLIREDIVYSIHSHRRRQAFTGVTDCRTRLLGVRGCGSGVAHMRVDSAVAALHAAVLGAGGGGVLRAGRGVPRSAQSALAAGSRPLRETCRPKHNHQLLSHYHITKPHNN